MDELIDLFDRSGKPTGVTVRRRRGQPLPEGMYWAVCNVWIANSRGELLIQRRSESKPNHPDLWCESAGGGIQAGESPEAAALRETFEELGVRLDAHSGGKVFEYVCRQTIHHVFLFQQDVPLSALRLQTDEVSDARYASTDAIRQMMRGGEFLIDGYLEDFFRMLPVLLAGAGKDD